MKSPSDISPQNWHRFFAMEGNNRAWELATGFRDEARDRELLNAAHASAWHWQAAGIELNHMRAKMLLAEVHALVGHGRTALAYAEEMRKYFLGKSDTPDWELAFAHAIYAHAAYADGKPELHRPAYAAAVAAIAAISSEKDRIIVLNTFCHIPKP